MTGQEVSPSSLTCQFHSPAVLPPSPRTPGWHPPLCTSRRKRRSLFPVISAWSLGIILTGPDWDVCPPQHQPLWWMKWTDGIKGGSQEKLLCLEGREVLDFMNSPKQCILTNDIVRPNSNFTLSEKTSLPYSVSACPVAFPSPFVTILLPQTLHSFSVCIPFWQGTKNKKVVLRHKWTGMGCKQTYYRPTETCIIGDIAASILFFFLRYNWHITLC